MGASSFAITLGAVGTFAHGLTRPECVLCCGNGSVYASHFGGGVTRISADGAGTDFLGTGDPPVATNGFAIALDGSFLCANLLPPGGVWRVGRDGSQTPFLTEVEGETLPSVNFVHIDPEGRTWVCVSTRREPRDLGYRPDVDDGYVVLIDTRGARIAADGLGYTNEAKLHPNGRWLYVNETFVRRTSRFAIAADGRLGARETVTEYGHGVYPDGLEFDQEGAFWLTSVVSNRIIRVTPDGRQSVLLEDYDRDSLERIEQAYQEGRLARHHLDGIESERLRSISSIAFGGPDRRTAYLGNLLDDCLYTFPSPVAGVRPPHWDLRS
jgi:sugar lactone lactonase YvrE